MQRHKFASYADYVHAQEELTLIKIANPHYRCFTSQAVVEAIWKSQRHPVQLGICHGVRDERELDLFERSFGGIWKGTEIVKELCDGDRIVHQDFCHVPDEWVGAADIVYTNSLDHAFDPWKAVKAWLACLSRNGQLFVEWTPWHARLGRHYKADCFAASEEEYRELLSSAGRIEEVFEVQDDPRFKRKIFQVY